MEDENINSSFSPEQSGTLLPKTGLYIDPANSSGAAERLPNEESIDNDLPSFKVPGLPTHVEKSADASEPDFDTRQISNDITEENIESDINKPKDSETASGPHKINKFKLSPAEQLKQSPVPYKEPQWGGLPDRQYKFEVLKNGTIIDNIELTEQSYYVFGRLPSCDVTMEHPSLSRYHAVVQYCSTPSSPMDSDSYERGWYLYDLDSTHGTWINKNKVAPNKYYRIRVGHVVKFGGSKRLNILQGPDDDCDEESELSISEMKEQRERQKREAEVLKQAGLAEEETKLQQLKAKEQSIGCTWGMDDEDAFEVSENNPFAAINPENEQLYLDDPKKTLKGYFEREGYEEPEYEVSDGGSGKYRCRVELPIDTPTGQPIVAEAVVSGKKREAVVACALEACRILDRHGVLRASKHESHKRKKKNWEDDDYYDSDDDTFLDRTGTIEKKRERRMQKAGKGDGGKVETHDSLLGKHEAILSEIAEIESRLEKAKKEAADTQGEDVDALDAYMLSIKSGAMDTKTKMKLKGQLLQLRQEEMKLRRLVNIAKPAALPQLKKPQFDQKNPKMSLPMFGKMKGVHKTTRKAIPEKPIGEMVNVEEDDNIEEEEEDDEEVIKKDTVLTEKESKMSTPAVRTTSDSSRVEKLYQNIHQQVSSKLSENMSAVSSKLKGPSLPPDSSKNIPSEKTETVAYQPKSLSRLPSKEVEFKTETVLVKRKHTEDFKKKKKMKPDQAIYDQSDPDYAVWLPPENQAGDGKTYLNDKYGY